MNRLEVSMCLIDHKIDNLVSKKNLIDIRLAELYEQRENLVSEWQNQECIIQENNSFKKMTRKEVEKLFKEVKNDGDL